ncbi:MAG TPA: dTMP kinase [Candidatus Omnitrophica bacterium]|nr:MAG: dTMP kinase [Omnitrophica WOR_2 bacterium GWA2_45_18]HBR14904.1 dTMP kinase [Candidatus Omnitrophota bacterium]
MKTVYKGRLITFEGSEGSGKSTQIEKLAHYLRQRKKPSLCLREPGGVVISEKIRELLLDVQNTAMSDRCETLLYMAARAQLVDEIIVPALKKGTIVLCDRFLDSTLVYQGYGNGVDLAFIKKIGDFVTRGIKPDLTFFFDIDAREGLARINRAKDRIERRSLHYHNKVREGYRQLARRSRGRIKTIVVNQNPEEIHRVVCRYVDRLLGL